MEKYDVIVVGAGNGGLIASAKVAQAGYKTLLLEKHNLPGGCATSFVRGRFEFEAALHELCFNGTSDEVDGIRKIFQDLGVNVELLYEDTLFRAISKGKDGYDVVLHSGIDNFIEDLEKIVPGCKEKVQDLFDLIKNINEAQDYMAACGGKINPFTLMGKYGDFVRCASHSMEDIERALGIPEKAMAIINTYWGYLGVPADDINGLHYLSMLTSYVKGKPSMPYNRSHELSLALVDAYQKFGGEIRYNSEVTKFLFDDNGAVVGVVANGEELYAKKVISNVIPNNVINRSESIKIPTRFKQLANARKLGMSFATIYIGLDKTMEELGIKDYSTFISIDNDSRVQFEKRKEFGMYVVNCLNKAIPNATPKGTSTLFFTIPFMQGDFPEDLKAEEYKEYKNALAEKYIKDYEQTIGVSVMPYIEEIAIATPATMARYLSTPEGAIYGYQTEEWDNIIARTVMEQAEYNIPNLQFCGGHYVRGDGYPSGYVTGDMAATAVINALKAEAEEGE
ncbi:MAG: NAD(P)/FAD-dependent oxidoreductase [Clostridia bacterium]|nr:NAD(P)/FAD-dependent oxidoreductase [Clostridia bacterium]